MRRVSNVPVLQSRNFLLTNLQFTNNVLPKHSNSEPILIKLMGLVCLLCLCYASNGYANLPLTKAQMLQDFDQLVANFRTYYAPWDYKVDHMGIDVESQISELRNELSSIGPEAASETYDFGGLVRRFITIFKDAHLSTQHFGRDWYTLPIKFDYIGGKFIVSKVSSKLVKERGIVPGMELVSFDGLKPMELVEQFRPYITTGSDITDLRDIANRFNMRTYLVPKSDQAIIELRAVPQPTNSSKKKPADTKKKPIAQKQRTLHIDLYWKKSNQFEQVFGNPLSFVKGELISFAPNLPIALETPYFEDDANGELSPEEKYWRTYNPTFEGTLRDSYGAVKFRLEKGECPIEHIGENGTTTKMNPLPIPSYIYSYRGKRIGLIRIPTYSIPILKGQDFGQTVFNYVATYRCLLQKMEKSVDALVIDQTGNGGGYVRYSAQLSRLFLPQPNPSSSHLLNADRKWMDQYIWFAKYYAQKNRSTSPAERDEYIVNYYTSIARQIAERIQSGKRFTDPIPLSDTMRTLMPDEKYVWKKPVMVLIDELSASGGDQFPMVLSKAGHFMFGQRTMGAGGCVEYIEPLTHSRECTSITRSLFFPDDAGVNSVDFATMIENNGVQPDYQYSVNLKDFRSQTPYAQYIRTFSTKLLGHIRKQRPSSP